MGGGVAKQSTVRAQNVHLLHSAGGAIFFLMEIIQEKNRERQR